MPSIGKNLNHKNTTFAIVSICFAILLTAYLNELQHHLLVNMEPLQFHTKKYKINFSTKNENAPSPVIIKILKRLPFLLLVFFFRFDITLVKFVIEIETLGEMKMPKNTRE